MGNNINSNNFFIHLKPGHMFSALAAFVIVYTAILIWIRHEMDIAIELDEHEKEISK
jgi:hypothetical protein